MPGRLPGSAPRARAGPPRAPPASSRRGSTRRARRSEPPGPGWPASSSHPGSTSSGSRPPRPMRNAAPNASQLGLDPDRRDRRRRSAGSCPARASTSCSTRSRCSSSTSSWRSPAEGGIGDRLEARARRLGLDDRVRFLGRVPDEDLPAVYRAGDVFAMMCRERWGGLEAEGFGIVFLEAAASGVPAIAGRSGGSHEAVIDGETGFVVDPDDVTVLAQRIERVARRARLAHPHGRRARDVGRRRARTTPASRSSRRWRPEISPTLAPLLVG